MSTESGLSEIIEEGKKLFFPDGISPLGSDSEFTFELWDFKQNILNKDTCKSISTMYDIAKLSMLRVYISTKPKYDSDNDHDDDDDSSRMSEVIFVSTDSYINTGDGDEAIGAAAEVFDISDSEIFFGPDVSSEETTLDDTVIYHGSPTLTSSVDSVNKMTITINHTNTLNDMIRTFSDCDILSKELNVKRILPDNTDEPGSGSGVLRDVLSCFWQEFYERCTLGTTAKVPFIRHDFTADTWKAIGRILVKGYQECHYFPNKMSIPFLEQVLFNNVYCDLNLHFLQYVSSQKREILTQAINDFSEVDSDDLLEVLDSYGCRRRITAETFPTILNEIAHKERVQKPMFVIDCWREITLHSLSLTPESLASICSNLQPTSKKVCQLLKFPNSLTPKQKDVENHLKRFIRELDETKLQKFMRFCTGSDLLVTDNIFVEFVDMTDFTRRPIGHTCGRVLKLPMRTSRTSDRNSMLFLKAMSG